MEHILKEKAKEQQRKGGEQYGRGQGGKVDQNSDQPFQRNPRALDQVAKAAGVSRDTAYKAKKRTRFT